MVAHLLWVSFASAAGGRRSEQNEAQRSNFSGAPSRRKIWAPQEGEQSSPRKRQKQQRQQKYRGVAQFGSASALGAEGRRFESCRLDHEKSHICLPDKCGIFRTKCSASAEREVCFASEAASCVKCAFGTIGGGTLTSHCAQHNTSRRQRRCFTWRSQTSRNIEKENPQ